ncbi:hypothetical protein [Persephonella sp.]
MKLTIEIPDEEVYEIGKETIRKKIEEYLEFIRLERDIKEISKEINETFSGEKYWQEVEKLRAEAWEEYKNGLELQ